MPGSHGDHLERRIRSGKVAAEHVEHAAVVVNEVAGGDVDAKASDTVLLERNENVSFLRTRHRVSKHEHEVEAIHSLAGVKRPARVEHKAPKVVRTARFRGQGDALIRMLAQHHRGVRQIEEPLDKCA